MSEDPASVSQQWRVNPKLAFGKLIAAFVLLIAGFALSDDDPVQLVVATVAAAGLFGWGVRDHAVPVRLRLEPDGVYVITGLARWRRLDWAQIEQIQVAVQSRLGLRTETLEIDSGDTIHVLGRHDLGTEPAEVAAVLRAARPGDRT